MPINTPLPEIFIGKTIANERIVNFLENKYDMLSSAIAVATSIEDKPETKCIWYSKDHVQTWLDEIDIMNADGIRFYFGAYGNAEAVSQAGQLCLVMVLTESNGGGHKDIIYENTDCYEDRLGATERGRNIEDLEVAGKAKEFNYGSLCPPACISGDSSFPLAEES